MGDNDAYDLEIVNYHEEVNNGVHKFISYSRLPIKTRKDEALLHS